MQYFSAYVRRGRPKIWSHDPFSTLNQIIFKFFWNSKILHVLAIKSKTHFTIYRGEFNFEFEFRERLSDKMYEEIPYFQAHTVSKSPFSRKQAQNGLKWADPTLYCVHVYAYSLLYFELFLAIKGWNSEKGLKVWFWAVTWPQGEPLWWRNKPVSTPLWSPPSS